MSKVGIVIPSYKYHQYLELCLASIVLSDDMADKEMDSSLSLELISKEQNCEYSTHKDK